MMLHCSYIDSLQVYAKQYNANALALDSRSFLTVYVEKLSLNDK